MSLKTTTHYHSSLLDSSLSAHFEHFFSTLSATFSTHSQLSFIKLSEPKILRLVGERLLFSDVARVSSSRSSAPGCCRATQGTWILEPRRKAKVNNINKLITSSLLELIDREVNTLQTHVLWELVIGWRLSLIQLCFNKWQIGSLLPLLVSHSQHPQVRGCGT